MHGPAASRQAIGGGLSGGSDAQGVAETGTDAACVRPGAAGTGSEAIDIATASVQEARQSFIEDVPSGQHGQCSSCAGTPAICSQGV